MSGRTHCLNRRSCKAKTPGKTCVRCRLTAMNRDPEMKARQMDGRSDAIRMGKSGWCPPEYHDLNKKLVNGGFSIGERRRIISEAAAKGAA